MEPEALIDKDKATTPAAPGEGRIRAVKRPPVNELLAKPIPADYLDSMTRRIATPPVRRAGAGQRKLLVFRLGQEWFGLAGENFIEAVDNARIHSLPAYKSGSAVMGVVNIRGNVEVCVSLSELLYAGGAASFAASATAGNAHSRQIGRLLVVDPGQLHVAFPVDEVAGVHPCDQNAMEPPPPSMGGESLILGLWRWQKRVVRVLDRDTFFKALMNSLVAT
ncbi:MAG TPA: chemotaxis protein CheW [Candidatus Methylacidiphilales bacterium]|nr:chemotaxis protein CheW [Candidatus Methylacidiphilales bacterium]